MQRANEAPLHASSTGRCGAEDGAQFSATRDSPSVPQNASSPGYRSAQRGQIFPLVIGAPHAGRQAGSARAGYFFLRFRFVPSGGLDFAGDSFVTA